tara:strand:+ start:479 stop:634 length:156 start_codon:yes stop_codon:yes gene_type:complete
MSKEEIIKDLEAIIPYKRSQAHVHGDDQGWIDDWEKQIESKLEEIRFDRGN